MRVMYLLGAALLAATAALAWQGLLLGEVWRALQAPGVAEALDRIFATGFAASAGVMAVLARRPGVAAQVVSVMLGLGVLSVLLAGVALLSIVIGDAPAVQPVRPLPALVMGVDAVVLVAAPLAHLWLGAREEMAQVRLPSPGRERERPAAPAA